MHLTQLTNKSQIKVGMKLVTSYYGNNGRVITIREIRGLEYFVENANDTYYYFSEPAHWYIVSNIKNYPKKKASELTKEQPCQLIKR